MWPPTKHPVPCCAWQKSCLVARDMTAAMMPAAVVIGMVRGCRCSGCNVVYHSNNTALLVENTYWMWVEDSSQSITHY